MNSAQPHSATWCSSPRLISVITHTRDASSRGQVFIACTEKPSIILNLDLHVLHLCAAPVNGAEEIRMLVCTSDAEGAPNQKI